MIMVAHLTLMMVVVRLTLMMILESPSLSPKVSWVQAAVWAMEESTQGMERRPMMLV